MTFKQQGKTWDEIKTDMLAPRHAEVVSWITRADPEGALMRGLRERDDRRVVANEAGGEPLVDVMFNGDVRRACRPEAALRLLKIGGIVLPRGW